MYMYIYVYVYTHRMYNRGSLHALHVTGDKLFLPSFSYANTVYVVNAKYFSMYNIKQVE